MKKTLLLILFLLPFLGFSQIVDLVKWNAKDDYYTPTTNTNVTAANISTSGGATINYTNNSGENVFYLAGNWPNPSQNSGGYDSSKYISLQFSANNGFNLDLTNFTFQCSSQGGSGQKFRIKYSTDINFLTNVYDLIGETSSPADWTQYNPTFSASQNTLMSGKTMYIRIYVYNTYNNFKLKIGSLASNGAATVKGSITPYSETLVAKDDNATSIKNNFSYIDVASNDIITSSSKPVTSVAIESQSANGTAVVTSDNKIKFTPATDFTGTTSFRYTAGDGTTTSTATVYVTVNAPTVSDLVKWNGPDNATPTIYAPSNTVSADNITGPTSDLLSTPNQGFKGTGWTTQFSIDESKYFQVTTSALEGHKIKLDRFNFTYTQDGSQNVTRYQVRYSKDNFATSYLLVDEAATAANKSLDLSNITLYPNEKITIRIYGYKLTPNTYDAPIFLANNNTKGSGTTPTITGAVLNYDATDLNANDDLITTQEKRAISFNPLTNDSNTTGATITFTQPTSGTGTVSVNGNVFIFTPDTNFKGTTSFTYTLTNGTKSSTATVVVYVNDLSPKLIIWNGAVQTPKAVVTNPNIVGNDLTFTGTGNLGIYNNYFNITGIQNGGSTAEDLTRYVQVSVTPKDKYNLTLTEFKFIYNSSGNQAASMFQVRYSKDPNFADNGTILLGPTAAVKETDTEVTLPFPTGTRVLSDKNETFYIRIYPYAVLSPDYGFFQIKNGYGGDIGPTITGIVEPSNLITAVADVATVSSTAATPISILANDENYTPLVSITTTQPAVGGTVQVNGTTNVIFTPTPGFTGTSTFEYTIYNGLNYSTATVTVNVKCEAPGNETNFGNNSWIGYVYKIVDGAGIPSNSFYPALPDSAVATYIGRVTENQNFDRDMDAGPVSGLTTEIPCETAPIDRFLVRYKMSVDIPEDALYHFNLGSDDGIRLYIDDVEVLNEWHTRGYATNYFTRDLTAGNHKFVLEYYEDGGLARNSFSFGLPKGDPSEYGEKVWNVYGYENGDITLTNVKYAGYYVDPNQNPDSRNFWPQDKSPSSATIWQGVMVPDNNFTMVYKRKGFECGRYELQNLTHDDAMQIYIDDVLVYSDPNWNPDYYVINSGTLYALNSNSRVEIRVREDGGDANLAINFVKNNTEHNGGPIGTIPNGSSLVIKGNTTLTSDLTVCSCTVNDNVTLTVPENITLTVDEDIHVLGQGKLLITNGGSLLQTSTSQTMFTGDQDDSFEIQRTTLVRRYDGTYWSMPVTQPGFRMVDFSPNTLGDKYLIFNPSKGWEVNYNGTEIMKTGKGYGIRAPQSHPIDTPQEFLGKFTGTPNNGDIPVTVEKGLWNLIGNPYPSAIDADAFLRDNPGVGSLYFWAHQSLPVQNGSGDGKYYYTDDFNIYNSLGTTTGNPYKRFEGSIATAQGFLVKVPAATTIINFNNGQREKGNNKQFYKTATTDIEKNRVWINITNTTGTFKQILVGYATGATNAIDVDFDALSMASANALDFYSINSSKKMTIQGRALPFLKSDTVPLGFILTTKGEYTIAIDHADGFFNEGQDIYLQDKTTGKITNLRLSNYTFTSEAGTFNSRFVLRYTDTTLGTDDFENNADGIFVAVKNKTINISSSNELINEVTVYNLLGQEVFSKKKISSNALEISNLQTGNQVLLVKTALENGSVSTKKIIMN